MSLCAECYAIAARIKVRMLTLRRSPSWSGDWSLNSFPNCLRQGLTTGHPAGGKTNQARSSFAAGGSADHQKVGQCI